VRQPRHSHRDDISLCLQGEEPVGAQIVLLRQSESTAQDLTSRRISGSVPADRNVRIRLVASTKSVSSLLFGVSSLSVVALLPGASVLRVRAR
jgi:hypothetical protein